MESSQEQGRRDLWSHGQVLAPSYTKAAKLSSALFVVVFFSQDIL